MKTIPLSIFLEENNFNDSFKDAVKHQVSVFQNAFIYLKYKFIRQNGISIGNFIIILTKLIYKLSIRI